MKFSHEEILNAIAVSKVLEQHVQSNSFLGELLADAGNPNIHYGREAIVTTYRREVFERRANIRLMENADETSKSNAVSLLAVLEFTGKYPQNYIFSVSFNCSDAHFTVWCGLLDDRIEVLCAMKGGHVQDYFFERVIK